VLAQDARVDECAHRALSFRMLARGHDLVDVPRQLQHVDVAVASTPKELSIRHGPSSEVQSRCSPLSIRTEPPSNSLI
jgi:hypothetical protein